MKKKIVKIFFFIINVNQGCVFRLFNDIKLNDKNDDLIENHTIISLTVLISCVFSHI